VLSQSAYRRSLLLIWLISSLLFILAAGNAIAVWEMGDPDDQLRLVQIRDWLAGQSWWDITQYRMNPPEGGPMHWSRLVDLPVGAGILLLTPLLGRSAAELATVIIIPVLTYGLVMSLMAAAAARIGGKWAGLIAAASLFAINPAVIQLIPMRIDHHGWQLVAFLVSTVALLRSDRPQLAAAAIGLASALWIEISIEGLPFAVLFLGVLGLRWLRDDQHLGVQLPVASVAFAGGAGLFYLITEGFASANHCDSLSPVHLAAAGAAAGIICVAHLLTARAIGRAKLAGRLVAGALSAGAALAALYAIAPQCAGDAFAGLDPLVREYWYNRTPEGLPLWQLRLSAILPEIAGMLAGAAGIVALWRRPSGLDPAEKLALILLFLGSLPVALQVTRAAVYPLCLAAILIAPLMVQLFERSNQLPGMGSRMALRIVALPLIAPSLVGGYADRLLSASSETMSPSEAAEEDAFLLLARKCHTGRFIHELDRLPPSQLMVGLDVSPAILQFTRHKVIATGHHRNQAAMRDVIRAYVGQPEVMRDVLRTRDVDYLVACKGSFELRIYSENAPEGFWARLDRGETFPWLVSQNDIGPYHVWRVDKDKLGS
jgi:hypothetical protein